MEEGLRIVVEREEDVVLRRFGGDKGVNREDEDEETVVASPYPLPPLVLPRDVTAVLAAVGAVRLDTDAAESIIHLEGPLFQSDVPVVVVAVPPPPPRFGVVLRLALLPILDVVLVVVVVRKWERFDMDGRIPREEDAAVRDGLVAPERVVFMVVMMLLLPGGRRMEALLRYQKKNTTTTTNNQTNKGSFVLCICTEHCKLLGGEV